MAESFFNQFLNKVLEEEVAAELEDVKIDLALNEYFDMLL